MMKQSIQAVKPEFLDRINKDVGFMVWLRPGNGLITHVEERFNKNEYYLVRVCASQLSVQDTLPLPVLERDKNVVVVLNDFVDKARKARDEDGKKLIFLFDEMSYATPTGVDEFASALLDRKLLGLELKAGDFVFGSGRLDADGNQLFGGIPLPLINRVAHYVIDFEPEHA